MGRQQQIAVLAAASLMAAGLTLAPPVVSARAAAPGLAPLTTAQVSALSVGVTDKVIVVFRDQVNAVPDTALLAGARKAAVAGVQSGVVQDLTRTHARDVRSFRLVNAVAATVSPAEARRLADDPAVAEVVPDEQIRFTEPTLATARTTAGGTPLPGACAPARQVQLDPQAIETIHAATQSGTGPAAQSLGYTGAGVKVGFIADGLDVDNPDFIRPNGQHVFVDYQDFSGTGTSAPTGGGEAFLDASSVAAQGRQTYDVAGYGAGLNRPCDIRVLGVAPGASLVGLNVFGSADIAFNSVFLEAIDYAVTVDHVDVLNESFGSNPFPDAGSLDLGQMADQAAVAAGVVVVASTGDAGITNTIGSPATDPEVISAGASTTYRAYAQTGVSGTIQPGVTGWLDNNISALSSAGYSQTGATVDVVAPGDLNWMLCTADLKRYADCSNFAGKPAPIALEGGTSEAAPLTAGVAALVIQAYRRTHHGTEPTPATVKKIIMSTAQDIAAPADQQGAGLVDAYQAVRAAASYSGSAAGVTGNAVLDSTTQFNAVAKPGSSRTFTETVRNDGAAPVDLKLSSRTLGAYRDLLSTDVSLDKTGDLRVVHFTVPRDRARLSASIAYRGRGSATNFSATVNLSLYTPTGQLAAYNLPEGNGNYGTAQVAQPTPGRWTALIYSAPAADGGTSGVVRLGVSAAAWVPFGHLSAGVLRIAPGRTKSVSLTVTSPRNPGDTSGSIVLRRSADRSFTAVNTVPVTQRSTVPTPDPSTTFTGVLTGGDGRATDTGQTAYYQVRVPAGLPVLNAEISTPNRRNSFLAELVDPVTHEAASTAGNAQLSTTVRGSALVPLRGTQLHVLHPNPGLWTVIVDFYGQVSGTALSQPFTVSLNRVPAPVTATGLPRSARTTLPREHSTVVDVTIRNPGTASEAYFIDARRHGSIDLRLAASTRAAVPVPIPTPKVPEYLVPPETTRLTATASARAPIYFDYLSVFGDPDLISAGPRTTKEPTGTFTSRFITAGDWFITPFRAGPVGPAGLTPVTAQTSMTATTAAFDPSVSSPTGDLWLGSFAPGAAVNAVVVGPGQQVTVPVRITPSAPRGSVVHGTVYVDDLSAINAEADQFEDAGVHFGGSEVAALSYAYTVG